MSKVMEETQENTSLPKVIMLASIQRIVKDYISIAKESEDNLFFENEFVGSEQKKDVAERDILRDIQEVWEVEMSREISARVFGAISTTIFAVEIGSSNKWQSGYQSEDNFDI